MDGNKVINSMKNLITYSYRGLYATICFIFRRKGKIDEMFAIDSDNQINMNANDAFVKREPSAMSEMHEDLYDKISFGIFYSTHSFVCYYLIRLNLKCLQK